MQTQQLPMLRILAILAALASPAWGQCAEEQKLTASDAAAGNRFSHRVSVSGDIAVVAAPFDDDAGALSGSVYVFSRTGSVWYQEQKLTASDAVANDLFGWSVAVSGDTAVIGAPHVNNGSPVSGSAYVFVHSQGAWTQQQKLTASDTIGYDFFGGSVSIDGDTIVVTSATGAAYIFVRSGNLWTEQQKLTSPIPAGNDSFAVSAAVHADTAIVGAFGDDDAGVDSGAAYVFVRTGGVWTQEQKLAASDAASGDTFGGHVSLEGCTAVVGADGNDGAGVDSGAVYVFVRAEGFWTQQQKLFADHEHESVGHSVAVSGDTILFGSTDGYLGWAYIFARSGAVWTLQQKLTASDADVFDGFGNSVSLDGDTAVVGAIGGRAAYVFQCPTFCFPPRCSDHGTCDEGACLCDTGFVGAGCDQCATDYYNYPACTYCLAAVTCTGNGTCNELGGCDCNTGFIGAACDDCGPDYYNYPTCTFCEASATCSDHGNCDQVGACNCNVRFAGAACDQCGLNRYDYPTCTFCEANTTCSGNGVCNPLGACACNGRFAGTPCNQCAPGYDDYPNCTAGPPGFGDDVCVGGSEPGSACARHSDCAGNGRCHTKNRFISTVIPPTATAHGLKVTLTSIDAGSVADPAAYNLTDRWAGVPTIGINDGILPPFNAARVQCSFVSRDWSTVGQIHLYGDVIVPRSFYNVAICATSNAATCSTALHAETAKWGDVVPPIALAQPNFQDVTSIVERFQGTPTGPSKTRTKLTNSIVNPLNPINFQEVSACVSAFQDTPFKLVVTTPPATCP